MVGTDLQTKRNCFSWDISASDLCC